MSNDKSKATWDRNATKIFIDQCLEQVLKRQRRGTTFTRNGWTAITNGFNEKTGRVYDKTQLKNKWDNLKKEWQVWNRCFGKETGLGWDPDKQTYNAPNDWWERKLKENPLYEKFREKGLPYSRELDSLFMDVSATGAHAYAPSSGRLPTNTDDDDVYRPSFEDMEEGSGDSDEVLRGTSTGLTAELEQTVYLNTSQATTSGGNRKRKRKRGNKKSNTLMLVDAVSRIADVSESDQQGDPSTLLGEAIADLLKIEAISNDTDFHSRCCQFLTSSRDARVTFMALKEHKEKLVAWLRLEVYKL